MLWGQIILLLSNSIKWNWIIINQCKLLSVYRYCPYLYLNEIGNLKISIKRIPIYNIFRPIQSTMALNEKINRLENTNTNRSLLKSKEKICFLILECIHFFK